MTIKSIKRFIVSLTPPVITTWYRRRSTRNRKFGFIKEYATWQDARNHATGYDSDIEKVFHSAIQVKNGTAVYERDGVIVDKIRHSWHLLASLLWIATRNDNKLNVLDFGGALGTSYFQNRNFLSHLKRLQWRIVEQPKFVAYGKKFFEDKHLTFHDNQEIEELARVEKPTVVLISSSLQYIESPYETLGRLLALNPRYVIFDKIPFLPDKNKDHIVVQKVSPSIYDASYPCWVFGLKKFFSFFEEHGYRLVEQINHDRQDWFSVAGTPADWNGYLFEKHDKL